MKFIFTILKYIYIYKSLQLALTFSRRRCEIVANQGYDLIYN